MALKNLADVLKALEALDEESTADASIFLWDANKKQLLAWDVSNDTITDILFAATYGPVLIDRARALERRILSTNGTLSTEAVA